MLRELKKHDWKQMLAIPDDRIPQVLILRGTRALKTQYDWGADSTTPRLRQKT